MPANDKSTQDYFGHAIILSDTHVLPIIVKGTVFKSLGKNMVNLCHTHDHTYIIYPNKWLIVEFSFISEYTAFLLFTELPIKGTDHGWNRFGFSAQGTIQSLKCKNQGRTNNHLRLNIETFKGITQTNGSKPPLISHKTCWLKNS